MTHSVDKGALVVVEESKSTPKTNAQRQAEYRARKKALNLVTAPIVTQPVISDVTVTPSTPKTDSTQKISEQEYQDVLAQRGKKIAQVVSRLLPSTNSHTCERLSRLVEMTSDGVLWMDCEDVCKIDLHTLNAYKRNSEGFRTLWHVAQDAGEDLRRARRAGIAHKHAVEGVPEPVYWKGEEVGIIVKFDHRLLEFLLKSDDPAKYRDSAASVSVSAQVGIVVQFSPRAPRPGPLAQDAPQSPADSVTPALPATPATPETQQNEEKG